MFLSIRMTLYSRVRRASTASVPSLASATSYPSLRSTSRSSARISESSSTTRMLGCVATAVSSSDPRALTHLGNQAIRQSGNWAVRQSGKSWLLDRPAIGGVAQLPCVSLAPELEERKAPALEAVHLPTPHRP